VIKNIKININTIKIINKIKGLSSIPLSKVGVFIGVLIGVLVDVLIGVLVGVLIGVLVGVFIGVLVGCSPHEAKDSPFLIPPPHSQHGWRAVN
jgi:hypothetical protein